MNQLKHANGSHVSTIYYDATQNVINEWELSCYGKPLRSSLTIDEVKEISQQVADRLNQKVHLTMIMVNDEVDDETFRPKKGGDAVMN